MGSSRRHCGDPLRHCLSLRLDAQGTPPHCPLQIPPRNDLLDLPSLPLLLSRPPPSYLISYLSSRCSNHTLLPPFLQPLNKNKDLLFHRAHRAVYSSLLSHQASRPASLYLRLLKLPMQCNQQGEETCNYLVFSPSKPPARHPKNASIFGAFSSLGELHTKQQPNKRAK